MITAATVLLVIATFASIAGALVMMKSLRSSPEGYEDADGFHYGRPLAQPVRQTVPARVLEHQSAA